jgi:hypothetical protein
MKFSFLTTLYLVSFYSAAQAYLDPITGSIIIQLIFAGVATVVVFFREKVFGIFKRKKIEEKVDVSQGDNDDA